MELSDWLELVADAGRELAETALGSVQVAFVRAPGAPPPELVQGVYLPMFSGGLALQLALLAEPHDCAQLARRFLGLAPEEELEADGLDVLGAFGNLIVGTLESRLGHRELRLGLPLALRGRAFALGGADSLEGVLEIEGSLLYIVLSATQSAAAQSAAAQSAAAQSAAAQSAAAQSRVPSGARSVPGSEASALPGVYPATSVIK